MTPYRKTINAIGLNSDSQGTDGFLFALFSLGDSLDNTASTGNPAKEIYAALSAANVGAHTLAVVKQRLNTFEAAWDRGQR
jgi:hypothetical protein